MRPSTARRRRGDDYLIIGHESFGIVEAVGPNVTYEYFHADNGAGIGASHQTGWTGLVAKLMQQCGE